MANETLDFRCRGEKIISKIIDLIHDLPQGERSAVIGSLMHVYVNREEMEGWGLWQ